MDDVRKIVEDIIVEELGVDRDKIVDDASFTEDLGGDSLDTMELIIALEKEFDIDMSDEESLKLRTVGEAVKYIQGRMEK